MTPGYPGPAAVLPHLYPFVLIDRVVEREEGRGIVCAKDVTCGEWFFSGLAAEDMIMPGSLLLEAMAQASGLIVGQSQPAAASLAAVSGATFGVRVRPGDLLVITALLIQEFRPYYVFDAEARVADMQAAGAEITVYIQ
jgi:3-hydroxymyristoyl/3-hydroxydecanoyl-(acyl carrier protein) dehydratase